MPEAPKIPRSVFVALGASLAMMALLGVALFDHPNGRIPRWDAVGIFVLFWAMLIGFVVGFWRRSNRI